MTSKEGHLDIVKYLVEECHANIEAKDNDGCTPLHRASDYEHLDIVKYLVEECHCNVEAKDNDGCTPLHRASDYEHLDIVKYLADTIIDLEKTSTPDSKNTPTWGKTTESKRGWGKTSTPDSKNTPTWGKTTESKGGWGKTTESKRGWGKTPTNDSKNTPTWGKTTESKGGWGKTTESKGGWGKTPTNDSKNTPTWGKTPTKTYSLDTFCAQEINEAIKKDDLQRVKSIIEEFHCNPKACDTNDKTPIQCALENNKYEIFKYLVEECHIPISDALKK